MHLATRHVKLMKLATLNLKIKTHSFIHLKNNGISRNSAFKLMHLATRHVKFQLMQLATRHVEFLKLATPQGGPEIVIVDAVVG